jgi:hypothetical protein
MRRYALTLLGLVALSLIAAAGVSWFGLDQCPLSDRNVCGIYHFQRAKLAAAPGTVDLVMVGDSSLGNEVDGELMGKLTGRTTLNLALSGGSLGIGTNCIQLQDALVDHRIRNVVIMFSPAGFRIASSWPRKAMSSRPAAISAAPRSRRRCFSAACWP